MRLHADGRTRQACEDVDPWPAELLKWDELILDHAASGLLDGPSPHEGQQDGDTLAARLDGLEAPEHHGYGLGVGAPRAGEVLLDDLAGCLLAPVEVKADRGGENVRQGGLLRQVT